MSGGEPVPSAASASQPAGGWGGDGATTRAVHDTLRRMILGGELEPGSAVSQLQLVRLLAVGRTPLREALRLLQREGLVVDNGPHRAVTVSALSMTDLDELYSLRVVGEALAVWSTVPVLTGPQLDELDRVAEATRDADADVHRRFHMLLRVGAGERFRDHLERLFEHAQRYQRAFSRQGSGEPLRQKLAEHREIAAACRRRDRTAARDLVVDHVASTALALMKAEHHVPSMLPLAVEMAREL